LAALVIALLIWIPSVHFFYAKPASAFYQAKGLSPKARELTERHLHLWADPKLREQELQRMRAKQG